MSQPYYRPSVAGLIVNHLDQIFVAQRIEFANSWQFPQGGRDAGETPLQTLHREMEEELSIRPEHYTVLESRAGYKYDFPKKHRRTGKFTGQEQVYFRLRLTASDSVINLNTAVPEFNAWKWVYPHEFNLLWLPEFKREVYRKVLEDFFQVSL
jgi:putative (di)nucleoside polyphosphate hydrolase